MKNTFVPLDKQSKKAQRAAVRANRALWQGVKLCPRIMRTKTDYRRKGRPGGGPGTLKRCDASRFLWIMNETAPRRGVAYM